MKMIRRSGFALGLVAAMGLAACSDLPTSGPDASLAPNLDVASQAGPATVDWVSGYQSTAVNPAVLKYRHLYVPNKNGFEGLLGPCESGTPGCVFTNGVTKDWYNTGFTYQDSNHVKLIFDGNNTVTATISNLTAGSPVTMTYIAANPLGSLNYLTINLKGQSYNGTPEIPKFNNAKLNGVALSNLTGIVGSADWYLTGIDLSAGFTLEGDLKLTTPFSNTGSDEATRMVVRMGYLAPTNVAPDADAGGPYTGDEGSDISISGASSSDPDGDPLTYKWTWASGGSGCTIADDDAVSTTVNCDDNTTIVSGPHKLRLTVSDGKAADVTSDADLTVSNVAPTLGALTVSSSLVAIGTAVTVSGSFTDPGTADTHTPFSTIDWDDGSTLAIASISSGTASGTRTYTAPGVYTVSLTVKDDDGGSDTESYQYVVVYDPSAGFVTGGGWINSPAGAYLADPDLEGRANFGFVSKYQKGATVPTGNTEFQFQAAGLNFHSSSYNWLVVNRNGLNAQFKGVGKLNGVDGYKFMIWATDKSKLNGTTDTFRIQITDASDNVVYDNAPLGTEQAIAGGSIVVHTGK